MVNGLGIDLVDVDRWDKVLKRSADFATSVFSSRERVCWGKRHDPVRHLAACFAAKEAFLKAVGIGLWEGVPLLEVEVLHEEPRQPRFKLGPLARKALRQAGCSEARLSITHEQRVAIAMVVVQ